ncbi:glycosyltransferase [Xylanibacter ruminicola]|uniref:glycosyltransferase n=1 Tax=Xylanibacter ruminicola TaxID=839 RepID=UPI00048D4386|nr:glycosyltransferase [Xylanibacter ruminicola]
MFDYLATVIVSAYNHERYITECLEGLANQTFKNFQLIITDDNSTDSTPRILKENQEKYGYQLILNQENVGLSASLTNMAKNYAHGKYIFICASDDVYMPNRIEKQVKYMEEHPNFAMCYARTIRIDLESKIIGKDSFQGYKSGYIFEDVFLRKYNLGICVAMKSEVLAELGYYRPELLAEDYYMNCKIAENYEIGFIDDYLLKYRVAPLGNKRDPWKLVESHRKTVEMFSYRPEYKQALQNWELQSGALIAPYKKYKLKALKYLVKNLFITRGKRNILYLYDIAKGLFTRMWEIKVS